MEPKQTPGHWLVPGQLILQTTKTSEKTCLFLNCFKQFNQVLKCNLEINKFTAQNTRFSILPLLVATLIVCVRYLKAS